MSLLEWSEGTVRVRVPATTANLGPGFDALGLALDFGDELTASITESGLSVTVHGEGECEVPLDETHLVVQSMYAAFDHLGERPPGLAIECRNVIPHARGLGSSSAAIVGGLALARSLAGADDTAFTDEQLFRIAATIEGHPDNVAPACFGGFTICGHDEAGFYAVPAPVSAQVSAVVLIPPYGATTEATRGLLPDSVPHADAALNAGRAALLVAALAGRPEELLRGTEDRLHQSYRRSAMSESWEIVRALRSQGVPAIISGAGPTVLAFCGPGLPDPEATEVAAPQGWRAVRTSVAGPGVTAVLE